jgi:deoxycytidylate deaminase
MNFRQDSTDPSELVFGMVGPIGCNRAHVQETIVNLAKHFSYRVVPIRVSEIIRRYADVYAPDEDQYVRVSNLIQAGNELRKRTSDNALLAKLAALEISRLRDATNPRTIYLIDSIKHPEEVDELRHIYGAGFFLFAIHSSQTQREQFLERVCLIKSKKKREELINRDSGEPLEHGQSTSEAFHRADFFLHEDGNNNKTWNTLERFLDIIFASPFKTPTFYEYAMFMAHGASMRSADLSRQVGAVVTKHEDILSYGANECPSPFGGTYWPTYNSTSGKIDDVKKGRDYTRGFDHNAREKRLIMERLKADIPSAVLDVLSKNIDASGLADITEYGRVVHAEMDAILACARRGVSCDEAVLFCTTFPCHNCAKHIVAAGVSKVIYIEPYPKSKAFEMHDDAIASPESQNSEERVVFAPFVGVGPRQFVDLFSMSLSAGAKMRRKESGSENKATWDRGSALPRLKMYPVSHRENESSVGNVLDVLGKIEPIRIK